MFDFTTINFADELLGIVIAIFQAILVAIITKMRLFVKISNNLLFYRRAKSAQHFSCAFYRN